MVIVVILHIPEVCVILCGCVCVCVCVYVCAECNEEDPSRDLG